MATAAYFEGAALIGGRAAYLIARQMRQTIEQQRRLNGGGTVPDDLAEALTALERAGEVWLAMQAAEQAEATEVPGTEALVPLEGQSSSQSALTSEQVGCLLGVSDRRVRQLSSSGELPARRVRGRWEFDRVVVQEFARKREYR
jgi:excisionase family DNA binding protein